MAKYRFKTMDEMLEEYGEDWRFEVGFNHEGEMDYLLGTILGSDTVPCYIWDSKRKLNWSITTNMVVEIKERKTEEREEMEKSTKIAVFVPTAPHHGQPASKAELIKSPAKFIQSATFNEKKKITTVVLKNGASATVKCSDSDTYDARVGFCLAYMNALFGSKTQVQKAMNEFNGVAQKERNAKALKEKLEAERRLREYQAKQAAAAKRKKETFERQLEAYTKEYEAKKAEALEKNKQKNKSDK